MALTFPVRVRKIKIRLPGVLDSLASIIMLRNSGEAVFPGVSSAEIEAFCEGDVTAERTADMQLEREGTLYINCGEGILDHHPHDQYPGKCAFTRTLDSLGLREHPALQEISAYVLFEDVRADPPNPEGVVPVFQEGSFTWGRIIKEWCDEVTATGDFVKDNVAHEQAFVELLAWFEGVFLRHVRRQVVFHTEGQEAYKGAWLDEVTAGDGCRYIVALGITGMRRFADYARWRGASVVVHCDDAVLPGNKEVLHVQIISNRRAELDMRQLAVRLRLEELRVRQVALHDHLRDRIGDEGAHPQVPEWYYMRKKGDQGSDMILAGSRQGRDAPGTKLEPDTIQEIVRAWLKDDLKEPPGPACQQWLSRMAAVADQQMTAKPSTSGPAHSTTGGKLPAASGDDKPPKRRRASPKKPRSSSKAPVPATVPADQSPSGAAPTPVIVAAAAPPDANPQSAPPTAAP